jgi:hypothetical protein
LYPNFSLPRENVLCKKQMLHMFMLLQKFSISKTNDIIIFTYFIHILQIVITNVALGNFYTRMSDENFSSEVRVLAARLIVSKKNKTRNMLTQHVKD